MSLSDNPALESVHSQSRRRAAGRLLAGACLPLLPAWLRAADSPTPPPPALTGRLELASEWNRKRSAAGFAVSEKFDGVRAVWDGERMRFRSGRPLAAPDWLLAALPPEPLDGELWLGRGRFDSLSAIVRSNLADANHWQSVRYMVFDMPAQPGSFSQRYARLQGLVAEAAQPWLQAVEQVHGGDAAGLERHLRELTQAGGEGLVLHRWDAPWQAGRSQAVYKFKLEPDAEATVLGHLPGKGKYTGGTGALLVESPQGVRFAIGSGLSDAQRADPPPVGAQVTYRYRGFTPSGVPRFATLLRVREEE